MYLYKNEHHRFYADGFLTHFLKKTDKKSTSNALTNVCKQYFEKKVEVLLMILKIKVLAWFAEESMFVSKMIIKEACMFTFDGIVAQLTSKLTESNNVKENSNLERLLLAISNVHSKEL